MTTEQKPSPKLKKSETLEVRIPHETKQAFLTACREDGTTASEVVRDKVQSYLDERERPQTQPQEALIMKFPETVRRYGPRIAASGVAAIALATFATLPSAAQQDLQAGFKRLDTNSDGVITADEFAGRFKGPNGEKGKNVVMESRIQTSDGEPDKGAPPPGAKMVVNQDAFTFWMPDDVGGAKAGGEQRTMTFISRSSSSASADGSAPAPSPASFSLEDLSKSEFDKYDGDKDGKVSFAEYQAHQTAMLTRGFEILDANGDQSLTQAEYDKIASPPLPKIPGLDDPSFKNGDGPRVQIMAGAPKYTPAQLKTAFTKLDANKDKKLSLKEYLPPA